MSDAFIKLESGSSLYHEILGDGAPILMMHGGLGLDHTYFRPFFDHLSKEYQLIYFDHFGCGRSNRPDDFAELTFDRLMDDTAELIGKLGYDKVTMIGHSYGAFIGQEFAYKYPDLLKALVLIAPAPVIDYQLKVHGTDEQMAAFQKLFTQLMTSDEEWRQTWNIAYQMYFKRFDPEIAAAIDKTMVYSHQAWNQCNKLLETFNALEKLPSINTPTLVVSGRDDGVTTIEDGYERIMARLPNAQGAIIEDCAHFPYIEKSDAFFATLEKWLASQK